ncbi:glycosyltransferase family 2 protein [Agromyces humatus]|uniref:4,4'-diaponeurosporenoate glycosyltransferase n=1 Tax=Agromyces humatus TaxID=279573 RepID=A0ABN2K3N5_9MICO|nr:glycosyltransferase family A protein [Agromyces humatus]
MGTISVIIPSLDDADFLAACLDALARQTRPADEIIVVDNGSTDATPDVAHAAGVRVVTEPTRGIWPATAAGFDAARGEILARLDADSVPAPNWIAEIERRMALRDRPTVLTNGGTFYGHNAAVRWIARNLYIGGYFTVIGAVLGHPPIYGSNYALRADAWRQLRHHVHRDRADLHDDLDLAWSLRPGMTVVREPRLAVSVSARPFDSLGAIGRRVRMAFHTLYVESGEWPPQERRADRSTAPAWVWDAAETEVATRDHDGDEPLLA